MPITANCKNNYSNISPIRDAIKARMACHSYEYSEITEWRAIPGLPYQISDTGSIKSLKRRKPRLLVPTLSNNKYFYITLTIDGKRKGFAVDRLVVSVFNNLPYSSIRKVIHKDEVKYNNQIANLKYSTWSDNENLKTG